MNPMIAAMLISAVTDAIITIASKVDGVDPIEFKKMVDALQVKADDLESWLKGDKEE